MSRVLIIGAAIVFAVPCFASTVSQNGRGLTTNSGAEEPQFLPDPGLVETEFLFLIEEETKQVASEQGSGSNEGAPSTVFSDLDSPDEQLLFPIVVPSFSLDSGRQQGATPSGPVVSDPGVAPEQTSDLGMDTDAAAMAAVPLPAGIWTLVAAILALFGTARVRSSSKA